MKWTVFGLTAVAASALAAPRSHADADVAAGTTDTRVAELETLVSEMRTEIRDLRAQQSVESPLRGEGDDWLTEARAEEIRSIVTDVLADADTRASMLQGVQAGHDGKFFLASADGNYRLNISGGIQIRYTYNNLDAGSTDEDENRSGFEVRRAKLVFDGHVVDPTWKYKVQGAFDRNIGQFILEEAFGQKAFENGFDVRFGQYKAPFLREELVSAKYLLFVDRTLVNERYNQDFTQGVEVGWESDSLRADAMLHDGLQSNGFRSPNGNTIGRNTGWQVEDTEYGFAGRAEWKASGTWKQFDDFTSWQGDDFGLMVGGAFNYQRDEYGTTAPNEIESENLGWTLDVSVEGGGWNAFAAYVGNRDEITSGGQAFTDNSFVVQGGFFIVPDEWELVARYEWGELDSARFPGGVGVTGTDENVSVITIGVNRYFKKHALKWQTDIGFGLDEVTSDWDSTGVGWRTDAPTEDGQFVVRSQFQLLF